MLSRLVQVAPRVLVATSRWYATTTTVLLDGAGGAVVIDPAWDPDELAAIPADLAELGVRCVAGVCTHRHYDHILWHQDLGDVPRWSTAGTVDAVARDREKVIAPLSPTSSLPTSSRSRDGFVRSRAMCSLTQRRA